MSTILPADLLVPSVAATQLALVEPHLDAGFPQRLADALRRLRVSRRIAEKD